MNGYLHVQHAVPAQILRGRQVDAMYQRFPHLFTLQLSYHSLHHCGAIKPIQLE